MVRYHGDGKLYAMKVLGKVRMGGGGKGKEWQSEGLKSTGKGKYPLGKLNAKEHIKRRNEVKHVMAERNVLLANISHPFLVSMHYSFQTRDKLYFVLDFLNGGEVRLKRESIELRECEFEVELNVIGVPGH